MIVRAAVFFHSCSSARADCLLALTCSTAGRPWGILAGSPRVGETGRWPAEATMVTTASICQGGDCQLVSVCKCLCFVTVHHRNILILEQRVVISSCVSLHILFSCASLISVLKIYLSCGVRLIWLLQFK